METKKVESSILGNVGVLKFNNPEKKNAWESNMQQETERILESWKNNKDIKVIVITGSGGSFSSGGDISEMGGITKDADPNLVINAIMRYGNIVKLIKQMPQTVIASVDGVAAGAGAGLALGCDYRIVSDAAKFMFAFTNIALSGDTACLFLLDQLVGTPKALEFMMTAKTLNADEIEKFNLANKVVPTEQLEKATMEFANTLANGPTLAYQKQKELIYSLKYEGIFEDYLKKEATLMAQSFTTKDFGIAVKAFMSKRKPVFEGK